MDVYLTSKLKSRPWQFNFEPDVRAGDFLRRPIVGLSKLGRRQIILLQVVGLVRDFITYMIASHATSRLQTRQGLAYTNNPSPKKIRWNRQRSCLVRAEGSTSQGSLTQVTLKRPLGLTLAEDNQQRVFVEALLQGGNAEASGKIKTGDILSK